VLPFRWVFCQVRKPLRRYRMDLKMIYTSGKVLQTVYRYVDTETHFCFSAPRSENSNNKDKCTCNPNILYGVNWLQSCHEPVAETFPCNLINRNFYNFWLTQNYNFARCFVWVRKLVAYTGGETYDGIV
jgi:hypothetical protein